MSDIREALQAAMDSAEGATAEPENTGTEIVSEPASVESSASERARDELGRFAAKQQAEAAQAEREPQKTVEPVAPAVKAPPKSWKKDYHEHWSKMDPALQDYTLQREDEYYRGIGSYRQQAEQWQQFLQAAQPYEPHLRSLNLSPVQAFTALANADHVLRTADPSTKAQMFQQLAQSYGIDLGTIQNPPQMDPHAQQLYGTVQQLQQRLQQQQQQFEELQRSFLQPQIEQIASRPHFDELRPSMAQLLNSGLATTLEEAYDKALRMSPHFETVMAQQRQESDRARLQEAAQAAAKAKAAAVQVKGSPSTVLPDAKRDLRSQIESAFDEHIR